MVTSLVLVPILINSIGLADFGLWVLATAVFGYTGLLEMGISSAVTRFVADRRGSKDLGSLAPILNSAFTFALAAGFLASVVLFLFALAGGSILHLGSSQVQAQRMVFAILGIRAVSAFAQALPEAILKGFERYSLPAAVGVITSIANFAITLLLLQLGYGIVELALLSVVLGGVSAALNALFMSKIEPSLDFRWTWHPVRDTPQMFRFAGAWTIVSVTSAMMYQADFLIIGVTLSTVAIGVYALIAKTNQLVREFEWLTVQAVTPLVSRLQAEGELAQRNTLLQIGTRYLTAAEYTIVATLLGVFPAFLLVWVGPAFVPWAWMGQVYLIYFLLTPSLAVGTYVLMGEGNLKPIVNWTLVIGVINLSLSVLLTIYLASILGVILGTVVSFLIAFPWWVRMYSKALGIDWKALIAPSLASYVPAAIAFSIGFVASMSGVIGTLAMLAVAVVASAGAGLGTYWFIFISKDERRLLLSQLGWGKEERIG